MSDDIDRTSTNISRLHRHAPVDYKMYGDKVFHARYRFTKIQQCIVGGMCLLPCWSFVSFRVWRNFWGCVRGWKNSNRKGRTEKMPLVPETTMADVGRLISLGNLLVRKIMWFVLTTTSATLIFVPHIWSQLQYKDCYIYSRLPRSHSITF